MQAPSADMHTNVASQRPQALLSELEVDKFMAVFVSKLDQNRDRREPEQRGDASLGSLGQSCSRIHGDQIGESVIKRWTTDYAETSRGSGNGTMN